MKNNYYSALNYLGGEYGEKKSFLVPIFFWAIVLVLLVYMF